MDEAHSSQSGESAAALKKVLAANSAATTWTRTATCSPRSALARGRHRDAVLLRVHRHAEGEDAGAVRHAATRPTGNCQPFHVYSMRQAIEEGFILDVLAQLHHLQDVLEAGQRPNPDDPEVDERKASAQLARFAVLHPTTIDAAGRDHRRALPRRTSRRARRPGQGDGGHPFPGARGPAVPGDRRRTSTSAATATVRALVAFSGELALRRRGRSPSRSSTGSARERCRRRSATRKRDDAARRRPNQARVPDPGRRGEVPDRLRPAAAHHDVRGQEADGVAAVQTLSRLNRTHPSRARTTCSCSTSPTRPRTSRKRSSRSTRRTITEPDRPEPALRRADARSCPARPARRLRDAGVRRRPYSPPNSAAKTDAAVAARHTPTLYRFTDPRRTGSPQLMADDPDAAEELPRRHCATTCACTASCRRSSPTTTRAGTALPLRAGTCSTGCHGVRTLAVDLGQVDLTHLRITKTGEHDVPDARGRTDAARLHRRRRGAEAPIRIRCRCPN